MKHPAISIVVPVYNTGNYIRQCLDSIRQQTFTDWECILVDDGSTDSSPEICDEYARADNRFIVIKQKNGGVSKARNAALRVARGTYIGFTDPDDWLEPTMYEHLYRLITENDASMAQVGFWKEYIGRRSTKHLTKKVRVIDGKQALTLMAFDLQPSYLWNRLHRREIITCEFPEGRNFEDMYVYGQWMMNVKKMVMDPTLLYHYRMRRGSIIHADAAKNRYDYFTACLRQMHLIEPLITTEADRKNRFSYINRTGMTACKYIARNEKNIELRDKVIEEISRILKDYPLPSIKYMSLKKWWRTKLLRKNPKLFIKLVRGVYKADIDSMHRNSHLYK